MFNQLSKSTIIRVVAAAVLGISSLTVIVESASAANCVPVKSKGASAGKISLGSISIPIKAFNYPAGGVMEPEKNTTSAGLSQRHMPLSSKVGSSVIVWHRDYKGCIHPLNAFMAKKPGTIFSVTDENGDKQRYRINLIKTIAKGDYKESWFNLIGSRQIVMFTCTGVFKSGHYEKNMVFIATPI